MRSRRILTALAAIATLASAANATTLYTAPLVRNGGQIFCLATNASPNALQVELRVMRDDGAYVGGYTANLAPSATAYTSTTGDSYDHCEFRFPGSPKRVRAMACTGPSGGPCVATAPAE